EALALDFAGLDAGRADVKPLCRPVDLGADPLDVGVEPAPRALLGPRHVVAELRPLVADVADGSHGRTPHNRCARTRWSGCARPRACETEQPVKDIRRTVLAANRRPPRAPIATLPDGDSLGEGGPEP